MFHFYSVLKLKSFSYYMGVVVFLIQMEIMTLLPMFVKL